MYLPGISVVIISHNEQGNIGDCLDSLMRVDYPADRLEIIVSTVPVTEPRRSYAGTRVSNFCRQSVANSHRRET